MGWRLQTVLRSRTNRLPDGWLSDVVEWLRFLPEAAGRDVGWAPPPAAAAAASAARPVSETWLWLGLNEGTSAPK